MGRHTIQLEHPKILWRPKGHVLQDLFDDDRVRARMEVVAHACLPEGAREVRGQWYQSTLRIVYRLTYRGARPHPRPRPP